ncbi:MAG: NAD-dependent epimerase/dehydratase family protein [Novosphingobium sp.]|nr:NAD-dependent epimerase/dehydratase family protein [Novosphingobium sp.]
MGATALVIGGSGPTGPFIVEELRARGFRVSVLNRGVHPYPFPDDVERIVGDPHFAEQMQAAVEGRTFDVTVATYGRLRVTSQVMAGQTGHFIGVGGCVGYRGFVDPRENFPTGLMLPVREDAQMAEAGDHEFEQQVARAEASLFNAIPGATLFRYPYVYGPRQVTPREWSLVRRVLDGRRSIVVMHGGMTIFSHIYSENAAHALLLAVDRPEVAAGKAYNCADDQQVEQRQLIEIGARALGVEMELISIPQVEQAQRALIQPVPYHFMGDVTAIRTELGYRDIVSAPEAIARTVLWYRDNPLEYGGEYEQRRKDVFDYEAEDKLIAIYRDYVAAVEAVEFRPLHENYAHHPYAHPKQHRQGRDERGR